MKYQLTKTQYMMDFWVYPVFGVLLGILASRQPWGGLLGLLAAGIFSWSFVEYALHRWLFHGVSSTTHDHQQHHAKPADYIGLSGGYTLLIFIALTVCLWLLMGDHSFALALGFMLGYYLYISLHYCFHHRRVEPGSWLYALKVRHVRHHVGGHENFGVTSPLWDKAFRTFR